MTAPEKAEALAAVGEERLAERLEIVTRLARRLFRVPIVLLSLLNQAGQLRLVSCQGFSVGALGTEFAFDRLTLDARGPTVVRDTSQDPRFREHPLVIGRPYVRFYAGTLVLGLEGRIAGVLSVVDREGNALAEGDLILLRDLARLAQTELQVLGLRRTQQALVRESEQLRESALIDSRTQLWNRHAMFELLDREFHRAKRLHETVSVILLQIDQLEALQAVYDRSVCDAVLQEVTARIKSVIRRSDYVARFGGDEFFVFLGRCDLSNATQLAERMRHAVRKTPVVGSQQSLAITVTLGVASSGDNTDWTPDSLVQLAEAALDTARRAGRDCVAAQEF